MRIPLLLLVVALSAQAIVEIEFKNKYATYAGTFVKTSIGSPHQQLNLFLSLYNTCSGLTVQDKKRNTDDGFDPNASKTFHKTGDYTNNSFVEGITGTDDFTFKDSKGKKQHLKQQPFTVTRYDKCAYHQDLSLAHSTATWTNEFLDSVLKDEKHKVVVLHFDSVPRSSFNPLPFYGQINIGGYPKKCDTNFHTVSEYVNDHGPAWQFKLDRVSAGKFAASEPGIGRLNLYTPYFNLPKDIYNQIAKELDVDTFGSLACNATKEFSYTVNGYDLIFKPQDYIDRTGMNFEQCPFFGKVNDEGNFFEVPLRVFARHCLLLDVEAKRIGFGDKKK